MAVAQTEIVLDARAPDFRLPATDGRTYALDDIAGEKGTVIVFICNHCPYVKAVIDRLVADARALMVEGVGFAAICSNDATAYPEDSFEAMQRFARAHAFPFPYLHDEEQSAARAYGAVCTPDFFGFDRDAQAEISRSPRRRPHTPPPPGARRELVEAMRAIAATGAAPGGPGAVDRLLDQVEGGARVRLVGGPSGPKCVRGSLRGTRGLDPRGRSKPGDRRTPPFIPGSPRSRSRSRRRAGRASRRGPRSACDRTLHCLQRGFHMPPGFRILLVFVPLAFDGALSGFGDGAIAMRVLELARIFADHRLFHGRPPRSRRVSRPRTDSSRGATVPDKSKQ